MSANVDIVPPDFAECDRRLAQARRHLASADASGVDPESSYILLYSAAHKAASAALLAEGRRVTGGEAAHVVLLREVRRVLGEHHAALLDALDRARRQRHRIAYGTDEVGQAQLASLRAAAERAIEAAASLVEERRAQAPSS
jgi:hypothetical protein